MNEPTTHQSTCPNCGYCPHCGRSAQPWTIPLPYVTHPGWTWRPTPWWEARTPYWGQQWTSGNITLCATASAALDPSVQVSWTNGEA